MAKRMATWDSSSYLKLSAVLEMYYSETGIHGDTKYRACNRLYNYRDAEIIDQAMLKEQVLFFLTFSLRTFPLNVVELFYSHWMPL